MKLYLLIRILDILSTYLVSTTGNLQEAAPVSRYLITLGWPAFTIINLSLSIALYLLINPKYPRAIIIFTWINALIVISNLSIYLYIRSI